MLISILRFSLEKVHNVEKMTFNFAISYDIL